MCVKYESAYSKIPDVNGKPIGAGAALLLSQTEWLSKTYGDENGRFVWTVTQCVKQTGLTRRQQQRIIPLLEQIGLLTHERHGEKGVRHFKLDHEKLSSFAPPVKNASRILRDAKTDSTSRNLIVTNSESDRHESCEQPIPDSTDGVNQIAPSEPTIHYKENPKEIPPIYVPQNGHGSKNSKPSDQQFAPPTLDEADAFIRGELRGSIADAENFYYHYTAIGWCMGRMPMRNWRAAAQKWMLNAKDRKIEANNSGAGRQSRPNKVCKPQSMADAQQEEEAAIRRLYGDGNV